MKQRLYIYTIFTLQFFLSMEILYYRLGIEGFNGIDRIANAIAIAMFFALPSLWTRRKSILFPYLLLIICYFLAISFYFKTYHTILPLSSLIMVNNLQGLAPSIINSIHKADVLLLLPASIFILFYCRYQKKISFKDGHKRHLFLVRLVAIVIILCSVLPIYCFPKEFHRTPAHLFTAVELKAFKKFGFIHFWIYQIQSFQGVSPVDKEYVTEYMKKQNPTIFSPDTVTTKKNLIMILVESMGSWPINLSVEELEITPNINRLIESNNNNIYLSNVLPQVKDGRSSDAQLILNTGLLPLHTGAAATLCSSNYFYSLPKALKEKGYQSHSFLCEAKMYWNQEATSKAYGFDVLHDNLWESGERVEADKQLFDAAIETLKNIETPFYAQIVTNSSHQPYVDTSNGDNPITKLNIPNDEVKYYLLAINEIDRQIGSFIERLEENDLYNNSIIVITGDHDEIGLNRYENRDKIELTDRYIPLIILNTPLTTDENQVIGQIDIYPSLLSIMGQPNYTFKGLGQSIFNNKCDSCAVYHNGEFVGNKRDSIVESKRELWKVSNLLLRMNYFSYVTIK